MEQIVAVVKQVEDGVPVVEVCQRVGITEQTFYRWKEKFVGLEVDQVRQLKQLQEENGKLTLEAPRLPENPGSVRDYP